MGYALVVGIAAMLALFVGAYMFDIARAVRLELPTRARTSLAEFVPGQSRQVVGRVRSGVGESLRSPLRGDACVAYVVIVETERIIGSMQGFSEIVRETKTVGFELEDGDAVVAVEPAGTHLSLTAGATIQVDPYEALDDPQAALLARHGWEEGKYSRRTLRFTVCVLAPGMRVAVSGRAEPDDQGGLVFRHAPDCPLGLSNAAEDLSPPPTRV